MNISKKQNAHSRLLRAAANVFGSRGFHAARVSDIVAEAGVAQGTFYLHFDSKEAIFMRLVDDFFGSLLGETLGRFPASTMADSAELAAQFRGMWITIIESCRRERVLTTLVLREARAIGPEIRIRVDDWYSKAAGAIDSYLRTATERGLLRRGMSDATAWALLGVTERAIHYACEVNTEMSSNTLADELLQLELTGLLGDQSGTQDTPRSTKTGGRTGAGPLGRDQ